MAFQKKTTFGNAEYSCYVINILRLGVEEGLKACAWRLTVFTFIRILLLATWGVSSIETFDDEFIRSKLPGLWLEFLALAGLITIAVIMILVTWQVDFTHFFHFLQNFSNFGVQC